jgi:ribosomal protein S18 acetylase RimI-like enzyme
VSGRFHIEALSKAHDRAGFSCGQPRIDSYFQTRVSQDVKNGYAKCYVAVEAATGSVAGFYTLSANSVLLADVPHLLAAKLPRYPTVPVVLIGWLGRDQRFSRIGLGEALVFDAIKRVVTAPIGAHAIFAEAIDEAAGRFYQGLGFMPLVSRPNAFFLPVATAVRILS